MSHPRVVLEGSKVGGVGRVADIDDGRVKRRAGDEATELVAGGGVVTDHHASERRRRQRRRRGAGVLRAQRDQYCGSEGGG